MKFMRWKLKGSGWTTDMGNKKGQRYVIEPLIDPVKSGPLRRQQGRYCLGLGNKGREEKDNVENSISNNSSQVIKIEHKL